MFARFITIIIFTMISSSAFASYCDRYPYQSAEWRGCKNAVAGQDSQGIANAAMRFQEANRRLGLNKTAVRDSQKLSAEQKTAFFKEQSAWESAIKQRCGQKMVCLADGVAARNDQIVKWYKKNAK